MKKCSICKEEKLLLLFNKNKTRKDGLSNVCRYCSREKSKVYYKNNGRKHKEVVAKRNKEIRLDIMTKVYDFLSKNPCINCGEDDITVLEFDHLRDKVKCVSDMMKRRNSWTVIQAEIEKCQILCANCHRRKTAKDQNWFVLEYIQGRLA